MEDQKINTDINLVKEEMIAIWAYLDTYDKIFESINKNQIKILENTAPGFFALVQTALIESSFGRLVRLMDPSYGNKNLCFRSRFCPCYQENILKLANEKFSEVCFEWNSGKYRILKTHLNSPDFSALSRYLPRLKSTVIPWPAGDAERCAMLILKLITSLQTKGKDHAQQRRNT